MPVLLFPGGPLGKLLPAFVLLLLTLSAGAQTPPGRIIIPRAAQVDLGHTGVHTHANAILFETGRTDLAAMKHDAAHFPGLTLRAHCRLPTDRAALPPELALPGDPPLPNPFGPINGGGSKPGWEVLPLHQNGRSTVKVVVPTRFANWLALQTPARRRAYLAPAQYWLEARWGSQATVGMEGQDGKMMRGQK